MLLFLLLADVVEEGPEFFTYWNLSHLFKCILFFFGFLYFKPILRDFFFVTVLQIYMLSYVKNIFFISFSNVKFFK